MNEGFSLKPCIYRILSIHQIILNVMILFHNKVHFCGFSEMKNPKTMSSIDLECYFKSDTMTISHFRCKLIKCNRTILAAYHPAPTAPIIQWRSWCSIPIFSPIGGGSCTTSVLLKICFPWNVKTLHTLNASVKLGRNY